jgi:plasmid maintenance system antidote protein VapI
MSAENRRLKGKLRELNKTYAQCADMLGITETAFVNKINGKSQFTLPEVLQICDWLGLDNQAKIHIFLDENLSNTQV